MTLKLINDILFGFGVVVALALFSIIIWVATRKREERDDLFSNPPNVKPHFKRGIVLGVGVIFLGLMITAILSFI